MNDSNKPLKPTSTLTSATINNTNSANTNNSENNTSSKLTSSRIDKVKNEPEKSENAYAAKLDVKEKLLVLNSDEWKKRTTLIVRDLVLVGLRK